MTNKTYDLIVIGGGPGGYVCAIRAAQLGLKVACVEKSKTLGGTCLNVGCIPSKALLHASERYHEAQHGLGVFGIQTGKVSLDLKQMMAHKNQVIKDNTAGIDFLFKKNKIDRLVGTGTVLSNNSVEITNGAKKEQVTGTRIVIATGSEVMTLPNITMDEEQIVSSTGALSLPKVPKTMVVIGGGVIGLELGAVWNRLGTEVTVVEYCDRILPPMDREISKQMQKILTAQGLIFKTSAKVTDAKPSKTGVTVSIEPASGGKAEEHKTEIVLVAIGRRPYTDNLGLEKVGVACDERGRIKTDKRLQTTVPGIYAIGDVIAGPMLAHKAEDEGVILAEILAGQTGHINYDIIPSIVYTAPEVAAIGKTEDELKDSGIAYKVGKFPFSANGRARAMNNTDGFVKFLSDAKTDQILGVHIIGHDAGALIAEVAIAMEFGASSEDIARTCHAHPTTSEAVKEAALAVDNRPIHI